MKGEIEIYIKKAVIVNRKNNLIGAYDMNIKNLLQTIKKRPQMFVGCLGVKGLWYFTNGFLYNNIVTDKCDKIDDTFRKEFHSWVHIEVQKITAKKFSSEVCKDPDEELKLFFKLVDSFFEEIGKRE